MAALAGGAWQDSNGGTTLTYRGVVTSSSPFKARENVQGEMTLVAWRYVLSEAAPAWLLVRLCSPTRCVALERQRGATRGLTGVAASEPLRFVYHVPGGGSLMPMMRVMCNEVTVNYRY